MTDQEQTARATKARELRYQKPIVKLLNWSDITSQLWEMQEDCDDIRWMTEDEEQIIDVLGDDEEAFEFKAAFSALSADCYQMIEDLGDIRRCDFMSTLGDDEDEASLFDLFFPAAGADGEYLGYDQVESDYFPLTGYETDAAINVAKKRLKKLTKEQILDASGYCLRIAVGFTSLVYRYNSLKGAIDVIKGQNGGMVKMMQSIDDQYEKWDEESRGGTFEYTAAGEKLDSMLRELPERFWVE